MDELPRLAFFLMAWLFVLALSAIGGGRRR
jgi:hypothetical protein